MGELYLSMVRLSMTFAIIIGTAVLLGRLAVYAAGRRADLRRGIRDAIPREKKEEIHL